jgi:hypothetical protein
MANEQYCIGRKHPPVLLDVPLIACFMVFCAIHGWASAEGIAPSTHCNVQTHVFRIDGPSTLPHYKAWLYAGDFLQGSLAGAGAGAGAGAALTSSVAPSALSIQSKQKRPNLVCFW